MNEPPDGALARAAQSGDVASLGVLLERHRARLYATAIAMLGHGPQAEDAVHDTFLIALRRISDLRDPGAARAWLMRILSNVCLAELRRPTLEAIAEIEPSGAMDRLPAEEALERTAVRDWVWAALGRLSEPLRLAVMLRYFSSANSYDAIADLCGVPVGTVRSRLNAARAKLANELLETAADAHPDARRYEQRVREVDAAMSAFERTGNQMLLRDVFASDLSFTLADGAERHGLDLYVSLLAADFEDGVRARPIRVIAGENVAIVELWLDSPPEQPLHCPPGLTQIHFHNGHMTQRISSHYAPRL